MAELLIFTKDIIGDDVYKTSKLPKRGFVITVQPDGWKWGTEELNNPIFRIFKFPGIDVSRFSQFLSWEVPVYPLSSHPSSVLNTLQMRQFKFDLDHPSLPDHAKLAVADDTRAQKTATIHVKINSIAGFQVKLASIADPLILGDPADHVIG